MSKKKHLCLLSLHHQMSLFVLCGRFDVMEEWDWPATWWDGSIRINYLVSVNWGQYLPFQVPNKDGGVSGGTHDELSCRRKEYIVVIKDVGSTLRPIKVRVQCFLDLCTCFCNSYVEDGSFVFLYKVLRRSFEAEGAVLLFYHFKDSDSVSICQPGDKCSTATRYESHCGTTWYYHPNV